MSNAVGTQDWLEVTKDLQIKAYVSDESTEQSRAATTSNENDEKLFGNNIREAVEVLRNLIT